MSLISVLSSIMEKADSKTTTQIQVCAVMEAFIKGWTEGSRSRDVVIVRKIPVAFCLFLCACTILHFLVNLTVNPSYYES